MRPKQRFVQIGNTGYNCLARKAPSRSACRWTRLGAGASVAKRAGADVDHKPDSVVIYEKGCASWKDTLSDTYTLLFENKSTSIVKLNFVQLKSFQPHGNQTFFSELKNPYYSPQTLPSSLYCEQIQTCVVCSLPSWKCFYCSRCNIVPTYVSLFCTAACLLKRKFYPLGQSDFESDTAIRSHRKPFCLI